MQFVVGFLHESIWGVASAARNAGDVHDFIRSYGSAPKILGLHNDLWGEFLNTAWCHMESHTNVENWSRDIHRSQKTRTHSDLKRPVVELLFGIPAFSCKGSKEEGCGAASWFEDWHHVGHGGSQLWQSWWNSKGITALRLHGLGPIGLTLTWSQDAKHRLAYFHGQPDFVSAICGLLCIRHLWKEHICANVVECWPSIVT